VILGAERGRTAGIRFADRPRLANYRNCEGFYRPGNRVGLPGLDGGRCRDRTCDPSRVKGVTIMEPIEIAGIDRNGGRRLLLFRSACVHVGWFNRTKEHSLSKLQCRCGLREVCRTESCVNSLRKPAVGMAEELGNLGH
jgi:hypothetical protein